jgi:hypothetical protein
MRPPLTPLGRSKGSNSIEGYNVSVEDAIAATEGEDLADAELLDRGRRASRGCHARCGC